jgi:hypothetical protein
MKALEEVKKTVYGYLEMLKRLMENERLTLKEVKTGNKYNYRGVYVLTRPDNDEVVYAGKTIEKEIKGRMEDHLGGSGESDPLTRKRPRVRSPSRLPLSYSFLLNTSTLSGGSTRFNE